VGETAVRRGSPQHMALVWLSQDVAMDAAGEDGDGSRYTFSRLANLYVLGTIYFAWGGKSWSRRDRWLSSSASVGGGGGDGDICYWEGVGCGTGGDIVSLDLPSNNLIGTLGVVTELGLLTGLQELTLSDNHLKGTIPTEMGHLHRLRSLRLDSNHLTGSLPVEVVTNLSLLETAKFEGNALASGLRNFAPCEEAPTELSADCGVVDATQPDMSWSSSTASFTPVLYPCCTICCSGRGGECLANERYGMTERPQTNDGP
jgi:hypothetical protein